jgi:V/A-type H+-transporting ATPase subunit F
VKIHCIADETTVRGFRLAGVRGEVARNAAEASALLDWALETPDCGLLLITDELAAGISARLEAMSCERAHPVVVIVPGPAGPQGGGRQLRRLARAAVGVRVE